ncbi:MAG: hypothetical protein R3Y38_07355 [Rikenellaceae bacterium]
MQKNQALKLTFFLTLILIFFTPKISLGQYFDLGTAPHSIKWKQIESKGNKYIFAEENLSEATRYMNYIDTLRPYINYGFTHPASNFPILMQPQNLSSNGLMMYAPKRMEINLPPDIETYSSPWLKHLAAHEYRHAVQFNNVNQHFIKGLSYVIGDQSVLIGAALLSLWFMEGDAVLAETQMSEYGRGLQPSFSMEYRAAIDELLNLPTSKIDKWFCGSYKDNVPSHYNIGYQLVSYSNERYGPEFWDKTVEYCSKYPFFIAPATIARKKFYNTSTKQIFYDTFKDLNTYWQSEGQNENSATLLELKNTSFTTYNSPMPLTDSTLLAVKTSFKRYSALVEININTLEERTLFHTGIISCKPTMDELGRVFWSEYRPSRFWDQKINSQLCYYDARESKRPKTIKHERQALFPLGLSDGEVAFINYDYNGRYSVRLLNSDTTIREFSNDTSLHGLCFDNQTQKFYAIALQDSGMSIISLDFKGEVSVVKPAAYISLSSLKAKDGKLYFNSIASGLDEVHMLDLLTEKEYQLSTSRYGSFEGMASKDNKTIFSTQYSLDGYLLASESVDTTKQVLYSKIPTNKVNPPRKKWDVPNMDTITVSDSTKIKVKSYDKLTHLFNIHSWAPLAFNPNTIFSENTIDVNIGATVMSQNILNSATAYLSYGWTSMGHTVKTGFDYRGLAPKFSADFQYSSSGRVSYNYADSTLRSSSMPGGKSSGFLSVTASAYLPIYLNTGYHIRLLQPSVGFYHDNTLFVQRSGTITQNMQKMTVMLQYIEQTRMATQDLQPRWGYALRAYYTANPFCKDFSYIYTGYASAYVPGFWVNHGIKLEATAQRQEFKYWSYSQKELLPRGASDDFNPANYLASSVNYKLPLWYPDAGINSILYFKRISASLGYDFARFSLSSNRNKYYNLQSYGVELIFDVNVLRTPSLATSQFGLWFFIPSDTNKLTFGANLSIPL